MTEDERRAIESLQDFLQEAPEVAETLLDLPWLADGVTEDESYAVYHLQTIVQEDPTVAVTLLGFPWLADGVTEDERNAVYDFREIMREAPAVAEDLLGFRWLANDLSEDESQAIYILQDIVREDPAIAETLLSFPWLADGLTGVESWSIRGFRDLYEIDRSRLSALTTKPWFKDGISYEEFMLLGDLGNIAYRSETDALAIIGMPFLETSEPVDALALRALRRLACCGEGVSRKFRQAMDHPTISDGISDEEAKIVATLHDARFFNPDIFDQLLDPDTVTLEDRTINLPHTGETELTIVRIRPGAERTMNLLERAVRTVEGFVETPFPVRHVIYLAENTYHGASNTWSNISGIHEMDTDEIPPVDTLHVMGHESAHWYWNIDWSLHWVEDGLGAFFQSLLKRQGNVAPSEPVVPIWPPHHPPCPIPGYIAELERLQRDAGVKTDCSDASGERFFQDLWRNLGDSVFRQGLAKLYLISRSGAVIAGCEDVRQVGMCEVEAAFKAAAPAEAEATVDRVIGRWYDNSQPYDNSHLDTSPPDPNLPNGVKITRAHISLDEDRPEDTRIDSFSASELWDERVFLFLHFSFPAVQQAREIPLTVVEHFEDGFAYRVRDGTYTLKPGRTQGSRPYFVGAGSGHTWLTSTSIGKMEIPPTWAPGRYWVSVYHGEQKVAEVEFEVTP